MSVEAVVVAVKLCTGCGIIKPLDDFHNHKAHADGKTSRCKTCNNAKAKAHFDSSPEYREKNRLKRKQWYADNPGMMAQHKRDARERDPEGMKNKRLLFSYHITLDDYTEIFTKQGMVCAVCGADDPGRDTDDFFQLDHDHGCCDSAISCGKCVRGILCNRCNSYVIPVFEGRRKGKIDDLLENVVAYMDAYEARRAILDATE